MKKIKAVDDLIKALDALSDPERKALSTTYFPTAMDVIGVSNPDQKAVIRELKKQYGDWSEKEWIAFCIALVDTGIFECQSIAFERIGRDQRLLQAITRRDLNALAKNLDNWASVDLFSVGIYGVLWGRGLVTDQDIKGLLDSGNHWERRIAVVSTVALNLRSRGGTGDTPRTLWVCETVVKDRHDMIQKALSWALRELSKRDWEAVIDFMEKHESSLARRVVREVTHKLDFGTKN
jgi:3-methyladenine DNA glycosylase AlkD